MCGIAGFISLKTPPRQELLHLGGQMAARLAHRGPDHQGVWADEDHGLALSHRRLSILDPRPDGQQPMTSADGRYVIVYNGEIYNHPAVRKDLTAAGAPPFRNGTDTETLLSAISAFGLETALERIEGMFAAGLWDRGTRTLYLFRDRIGQKPLYFGFRNRTFYFASELRALGVLPDFAQTIDADALALFVQFGYVPDPFSIFRAAWKLPPGTVLPVPLDALNAGMRPAPHPDGATDMAPLPYWSATKTALTGVDESRAGTRGGPVEAAEDLDLLLTEVVWDCMISDVPLGAFLSGGIDSSLVVALMQKTSALPVKTFTLGIGDDPVYDEARHAKRVAAHLGTEHTELYVTGADIRDTVPRLPRIYDEPFADASQLPTRMIAELARTHVKVCLSGDGGDELFAGYNRYRMLPEIAARNARTPVRIARLLAGLILSQPTHRWDALFARLSGLLPKSLAASLPGDKLHKFADTLGERDPDRLLTLILSLNPDPDRLVRHGNRLPNLIAVGDAAGDAASFVNRMMVIDMLRYLPGDILAKVDRAAMSVSLETRMPLLDRRVVEAAWRLPIQHKIVNGQGKAILRDILGRYVPRALFERPKAGFAIPLHRWLRGPLRDWAEDLLSDDALAGHGLLDPGAVRGLWEEHQSGRRDRQYALWTVLTFQAWHREYLRP